LLVAVAVNMVGTQRINGDEKYVGVGNWFG
jgi:hypothetical protein